MENEFRRYLECGLHAHGFARAVCEACGDELLLPFSCKRRGICPACNTRRMSNTAAHLMDCVIPPDVTLRQWVLSVPFELRLLLAAKPAIMAGDATPSEDLNMTDIAFLAFAEESGHFETELAEALGPEEARRVVNSPDMCFSTATHQFEQGPATNDQRP